jgi:Flp pilus assembly CpaE family ATPase
VVDLIQPGVDCDLALVAQTMLLHASGVHVLLNPANPAEAELITPTHVEVVLELLARLSDYVIIDCPPTHHTAAIKGYCSACRAGTALNSSVEG